MDEVKEIDLIELFLSLFLFIKKNLIILLLAFLLGGSIGFAYFKIKKETYSYSITINSMNLPKEIVFEEIGLFNEILLNSNGDSVFAEMNMPSSIIKKLKSVTTNSTEENSTRIAINIVAYGEVSEQEFTDVLKKYLLNNKYIQELMIQKKGELEETIAFIDNQLNNLQDKIEPNKAGTEYIFTDETPTDLFLKKNNYSKQLKFLAPFVVENYPLLPKLSGNGPIAITIIGGFISILLVVLFFVFRYINSISNKIETISLSKNSYSKSA